MEDPRFTLPLVRTRQELLDRGIGDSEIREALRTGALLRVRRGAYVDGPLDRTREAQAALASVAAVGTRSGDAVFSHATAAALWQLPFLGPPPETIHLTAPGKVHGMRRAGVHHHAGTLTSGEIVEHRGIRLTSLPRTLVDVARTQGFRDGVVMADHALRRSRDPGALRQAVRACIERLPGATGIGNARRMVEFTVPAAESPGESLSRIVFAEQQVPEPLLQYRLTVRLPGGVPGHFVSDFGWKRQRTVGEFDGRVKYGRCLREDQTPGDAVFEEKRREDAIRSADWYVLRWTWDELSRPAVLGRRVREILAARS